MNDYLRKQVEADMPEGWLNRKEERVVRTIYRLANGAQFISDFARAKVYYYISNGRILRWESKDVNRDPIQVARQIVRGGVETFVIIDFDILNSIAKKVDHLPEPGKRK
jgi:hypothetical protein